MGVTAIAASNAHSLKLAKSTAGLAPGEESAKTILNAAESASPVDLDSKISAKCGDFEHSPRESRTSRTAWRSEMNSNFQATSLSLIRSSKDVS